MENWHLRREASRLRVELAVACGMPRDAAMRRELDAIMARARSITASGRS